MTPDLRNMMRSWASLRGSDSARLAPTPLQRKHACKITVDHDGEHVCICGKTWERKD